MLLDLKVETLLDKLLVLHSAQFDGHGAIPSLSGMNLDSPRINPTNLHMNQDYSHVNRGYTG